MANTDRRRVGVLALCLLAAATCIPAALAADGDVTVMSYNVRWRSAHFRVTIDLIERESPDILCLQEITPGFVREFEERLGDVYPYRKFAPDPVFSAGIGIASRIPLSEVRLFDLGPETCPAMDALVDLNGRPVRIVSLHLWPAVRKTNHTAGLLPPVSRNRAAREVQIGRIVKRYGAADHAVLLAGDMNEWPEGTAAEAFEKAGFQDACATAGAECGGTWPGATSSWPAMFRIDYVYAKRLAVASAQVVQGGASDHYPMLVTIRP